MATATQKSPAAKQRAPSVAHRRARHVRGAASDDTDAERWLDEGGSFSSEAVASWSAALIAPPERLVPGKDAS